MSDDSYVSDLENQIENILLEKETSPVDLIIVIYLNLKDMNLRSKDKYMKQSINAFNKALGDSDRIKVVGLESDENKIDYVPVRSLLTGSNIESDTNTQEKLDRILDELTKKNEK